MCSRIVAAISLALLVGACSHAPEPASPPVALVPTPEPTFLASPAIAFLDDAPPALPPARDHQLSLIGMVTLPRSVAGLANAREGVVVGTPVEVLDVLSGSRLGQGSTFYDGSYVVEVPARVGKRPVVLKVALVDAVTRKPLCPLYAPAVLATDEEHQTLDVGPGSTAWLALLYALAARKTAQPAPDWAQLMPGLATRTLAELIVGQQPDEAWKFASYAEGPALGAPTSAGELRQAIDQVVAGFVARLPAAP
jgi:hypothetical protein